MLQYDQFMRIIASLLLVLLLFSSAGFAYHNHEYGLEHRSVSLLVFSSSKFQSYSYGLSYEKENIEAYLYSHKIPGLYLFGVNKKQKIADWATLQLGLDGQKTVTDIPIGVGMGIILGWDFGSFGLNSPLLTTFYTNSAMTIEFSPNLTYEKWIIGLRWLTWFVADEGSLNESSWLLGYRIKL